MKNVFKTLGILLITAAVVLIVSCGPPVEPEPQVTKNADGSYSVDKGATPTKPADPTKTVLEDPGLYKNFTGYHFDGWFVNDAPFDDWGKEASADIKIVPKFSLPTGVKIDLTSTTGSDDVTKTFNYINNTATTINSGDKFTLYITANAAPSGALALTKTYADLTITSDRERDIKSPNLSTSGNEFIVVGKASGGAATDNIKLTLKNVAVVGSEVATKNCLIRIKIGGELVLDSKSTVEKHINSLGLKVGGSDPAAEGSGLYGNGAAICVYQGGTLTIKEGANITNNRSTGDQSNKNLVGGIYAIGASSSVKSTVNIEGGYIAENECIDGNTADVYITETVKLTMKGNLTIGELCINADNPSSDTDTTYSSFAYPDFQITGKVTNTINKFNLRSTKSNLAQVQGAWTASNAKVFTGTSTYDITPADVAQFKLWEFTGKTSLRGTGTGVKPNDEKTWENWIDPDKYEIQIKGANPNYGQLVTK